MVGSSAISLMSLAALFPAALAFPVWGPGWGWSTTETTWTAPYTSPTWTYPSSLPTAFSTGMPYPTATGTATGTGYAYPTGWTMNKREAEEFAHEKRDAFEGPRKRDWPHSWPAPYTCTEGWGSTGFPTGSGIAYPTATGSWP